MGINKILRQILNMEKNIPVDILPSRGLFYKDDFKLSIKKVELSDIIEYEMGFDKSNVGSVIQRVKKIVEKNIVLASGYKFYDIKSADIVFLFLEIVKFTTKKPINIEYVDNMGTVNTISFGETSFNYINIPDNVMEKYDTINKEFLIDGFKFAAPTIGVENSLTHFLVSISSTSKISKYKDYSYDFIYFLGQKNVLNSTEIENLLQIFNNDLSDEDKSKVSEIVNEFKALSEYSLKNDGGIIEITSKINLENIWS